MLVVGVAGPGAFCRRAPGARGVAVGDGDGSELRGRVLWDADGGCAVYVFGGEALAALQDVVGVAAPHAFWDRGPALGVSVGSCDRGDDDGRILGVVVDAVRRFGVDAGVSFLVVIKVACPGTESGGGPPADLLEVDGDRVQGGGAVRRGAVLTDDLFHVGAIVVGLVIAAVAAPRAVSGEAPAIVGGVVDGDLLGA